MIGLGLGLGWTRRPGAKIFVPASEALPGWWRGSFSSSPWHGTASAGGSGSLDLTEATNPPTVGTAVNGFTPASFNGTNQLLSHATAMPSLISTSAYFVWALIKIGSISTGDATHAFNNGAVFMDNAGTFGISVSNNMGGVGGNCVQFYHFDGSERIIETSISTGQYALCQMRFDGSSFRTKVGNGSVQTHAAGNLSSLGATVYVGCNYNGAHFLNFELMELGFMNAAESDSSFDDNLSQVRGRYPAMGL